jgi:hypothetical protein
MTALIMHPTKSIIGPYIFFITGCVLLFFLELEVTPKVMKNLNYYMQWYAKLKSHMSNC